MDNKFFSNKILKESFNKHETKLNKDYNNLVKKRQNDIKNLTGKLNNDTLFIDDKDKIINKKKNTNLDIDKLYKKKMFERNFFNKVEQKKDYDPTYYLHPIKNMERENLKKDRKKEYHDIKNNNNVSEEDEVITNFKNLGILD